MITAIFLNVPLKFTEGSSSRHLNKLTVTRADNGIQFSTDKKCTVSNENTSVLVNFLLVYRPTYRQRVS